jgi:argininosuccinate lyase
MNKLWTNSKKHNKKVEIFLSQKDTFFDNTLLKYDVIGSMGHAKSLQKANILSKKELKQILDTLSKLKNDKNFKVKLEDEDCHTAIEKFLIKKLGKAGKKIHAGRSRNDQACCALRLYMKDQIKLINNKSLKLCQALLSLAKKYEFIFLPGYTHTQQAMPSSFGHWASSHLECILLSIKQLQSSYKEINLSPLGSAAGYGTNIEVDRLNTAENLEFKDIIQNTLAVQNSKIQIENNYLFNLHRLSSNCQKFASDLILYSSKEFDFIKISDFLTTGSSIMPQKQNLDTAELIRAYSAKIYGYLSSNINLEKNLISGYHRDFQVSKENVILASELLIEIIEITTLLSKNIKPKQKSISNKTSNQIFATDITNQKVLNGANFRDAYLETKLELDNINEIEPINYLKNKKNVGSPGNLQLEKYTIKINKLKTSLK